MPHLFNDDGSLVAHYPGPDNRVFVLKGLTATPTAEAVAKAIKDKTPTDIAGGHVVWTAKEPVLRDLAATVFSESSHNSQESEGVLRVIRNRAALKHVSYGAGGFWAAIGGDRIDGRNTGNYTTYNAKAIDTWAAATAKSDLSATVRGIVRATDISGGAYFWYATSSTPSAAYFAKTDTADPAPVKPRIWVVTATLGKSTFLKYNTASKTFGKHVWP